MPYILNKTDGTIVATVQDASLDQTTDLTFVGRNYAGYGEIQNENFLKLLENFSNISAPIKPIEGQLWFDKNFDNKKLNVYDGSNWKTVANLEVSNENPSTRNISPKSPKSGDLWYDTTESQLYVFNGVRYILVGPTVGADTQAGWRGDADGDKDQGEIRNYNIKAVIGSENDVIAIVSASEAYELPNSPYSFTRYTGDYEKIYRGITLKGADKVTGRSDTKGVYFWGTAAHSLIANTATNATNIITSDVTTNSTINPIFYIPFVKSNSESSSAFVHKNFLTYNSNSKTLKAEIFEGTATRARYADLAEKYESDKFYNPGTVVVIGGTKEITMSSYRADPSVAGVISKNPGHMMNSDAGPDETHPYVALKGRVFCKVSGKVSKGDMLVTSTKPGHAEAWRSGDNPNAVFARALQDFDGGYGVIEVKI